MKRLQLGGIVIDAESWTTMPSGWARVVLEGGCILHVHPTLMGEPNRPLTEEDV